LPDADQSSKKYFEEIGKYVLRYNNLSITGLNDLVLTDKIPADHTFISASIPFGYT